MAGPQLLTTSGLVAGFFTCYGTTGMTSSLAWRLPFIILASCSVLFAIASFLWLVPSPRWLMLRGRCSEVSAAWDVLEVGHAEREKAEIELRATVVGSSRTIEPARTLRLQESSHMRGQGSSVKHKFLDVFSRDVRSRTLLAVFLLGMQQLSGIDGVLYVSC